MPTTASWISKTPDRCGGDACVRDTRITVWGLASYRRLGLSDPQILDAVRGLTPADLEAAWEYVAANAEEIDRAIQENEAGEEILITEGGKPVAKLVSPQAPEPVDARKIIEAFKEYSRRQGRSLGDVTFRDMIDEGHRY